MEHGLKTLVNLLFLPTRDLDSNLKPRKRSLTGFLKRLDQKYGKIKLLINQLPMCKGNEKSSVGNFSPFANTALRLLLL